MKCEKRRHRKNSGLSYHLFHDAVVRGWWSAIIPSYCSQGLAVSYSYQHHVAVVRGWWSANIIMLLWSEVGQRLVVSCCHHVAVVRGWWYHHYHLTFDRFGNCAPIQKEELFRNAFGKNRKVTVRLLYESLLFLALFFLFFSATVTLLAMTLQLFYRSIIYYTVTLLVFYTTIL